MPHFRPYSILCYAARLSETRLPSMALVCGNEAIRPVLSRRFVLSSSICGRRCRNFPRFLRRILHSYAATCFFSSKDGPRSLETSWSSENLPCCRYAKINLWRLTNWSIGFSLLWKLNVDWVPLILENWSKIMEFLKKNIKFITSCYLLLNFMFYLINEVLTRIHRSNIVQSLCCVLQSDL